MWANILRMNVPAGQLAGAVVPVSAGSFWAPVFQCGVCLFSACDSENIRFRLIGDSELLHNQDDPCNFISPAEQLNQEFDGFR